MKERRSPTPAAVRKRRAIRRLQQAMDEQRLCLHYQPIVDARTSRADRVEALLRRSAPPDEDASPRLRFGEVEVDAAARTVRRRGRRVELAPKELDLLLALLRSRGAAVSRLTLMTQVWGYSSAVVSRTVDTHVAELRRKLEDTPSNPKHILTVRKVGYRLDG